jgi:hypothetical protein
MNVRKRSWALAASAALLLFAGSCAKSGTENPPVAAAPNPESQPANPEVKQIMKRMCATFGHAKAFRFHVEAVIDKPHQETGKLVQCERDSIVTSLPPDRLYLETKGDDGAWAAWYNGKTLTILSKDANTYATEAISGHTVEMLDHMADKYDLVMPMSDFLISNVYDSLFAHVKAGEYLGLHNVGDTPCHHLLFRQEDINWQIWIDAGETPLPRKLVICYKTQPGEPEYAATLSDWDLSPEVPTETFTFTPPPGAKPVTMAALIDKDEGERP